MEAWKDELYHYGVKNMKWGKRKKSSAETAARNYENAYRRYSETKSEQDFKAADRNKSSRALNNYKNAYNAKTIARGGINHVIGIKLAKARDDEAAWNRHSNAFRKNVKKRSKAATHRKVQAANAKNKAKSYVKNLFKRKKK